MCECQKKKKKISSPSALKNAEMGSDSFYFYILRMDYLQYICIVWEIWIWIQFKQKKIKNLEKHKASDFQISNVPCLWY